MRTMDVVPYDENWVTLFESEKAILENILGEHVVRIEHIGSTSIQGIYAKPIIDLLVLVKCVTDIDKYDSQMLAAGYDVRGEKGMPGRRYFVRFKGDGSGNHTHHIHIFQADNNPSHQDVEDNLIFRDYLRIDETARDEYSNLKIKLSKLHYTEPLSYHEGKTECVQNIVKRAREYFNTLK
ncbi:MAG: GrpB family protein [Defluviitaleaceae bacterium]|nr:GrpB family protein [Defluviitaleaceae bacterium]